jgi:hypothetical protein
MCTQTGCTRALPVTLGAAPMANGSHGVLAKPRIQPLQSGGGAVRYTTVASLFYRSKPPVEI